MNSDQEYVDRIFLRHLPSNSSFLGETEASQITYIEIPDESTASGLGASTGHAHAPKVDTYMKHMITPKDQLSALRQCGPSGVRSTSGAM